MLGTNACAEAAHSRRLRERMDPELSLAFKRRAPLPEPPSSAARVPASRAEAEAEAEAEAAAEVLPCTWNGFPTSVADAACVACSMDRSASGVILEPTDSGRTSLRVCELVLVEASALLGASFLTQQSRPEQSKSVS